MPKKISVADFKAEVTDSPVPVLVMLSASWCGPCGRFAQTMDVVQRLAVERIKVVMLDIDEIHREPASLAYRAVTQPGFIEGVPTTLRFHDKRVSSNRLIGAHSLEETLRWSERVLGMRLIDPQAYTGADVPRTDPAPG